MRISGLVFATFAIVFRFNRRKTQKEAFQTSLGTSIQKAALALPELVNRANCRSINNLFKTKGEKGKLHHEKQLCGVTGWLLTVAAITFLWSVFSVREASSSCTSPANSIEAENCLPGTPSSTWDLDSAIGDTTIQGFATDMSVNVGDTVHFKVKANTSNYKLDIYRMGYYGGMGARKVATVFPVSFPQQPPCITLAQTGLTDCGNWMETALWDVPANATSGIYFAKATRTDTGGASHIFFIVRNDASHSDILFKTSDATWQAYNSYSQNFYGCDGTFVSSCRAFKISYNRPFYTRSFEPETWVFNAEYPMVRWLEANGYDVTYFTDVDTDRNGSLILNHKIWLSSGHDEYWSGNQRANVEAARNAGVHLAFFTGNTNYWKTRWESSIDGAGVPYRTLVCYKETWADAVIDPEDPPTWTGTWRDPRFSPPADGGRPENALMGTWSRVVGPYSGTITVPQSDGRMRFWRNTDIATLNPGQTATLAPGSLGEELDADEDNGFRPAGLFHLSTSAVNSDQILLDYGSTVGSGTMVHHLTLYRHSSGSLVFSAGTYNWARGLVANDIRMQQATVNLFADMGVQPVNLQPGLASATASTDQVAPNSSITAPSAGSSFTVGASVTITGTAVDSGGGVVGGVEISGDGGTTWHPATGRESWSYSWTPPTVGPTVIKSRAVDDSGNLEIPSVGIGVTVVAACTSCGSGFWPDTTVPGVVDGGPDSPVELGVQFRSAVNGTITGIRFYKGSTNTGTHVANFWSSNGTLLATATFTGETASGWQQVVFSSPVSITANTVYTVSYHTLNGHYSADENYFPASGLTSGSLHIEGSVYRYGSTSAFPTQTYNGTNYWVDVVFSSGPAPTLSSIAVTPASPTISTGSTQPFTATGTYSNGSTQNLTSQVTWASSITSVATINSAGLATAVNAGSTTISATLGTAIGSTTLTVQTTPLTITTTSLFGGNLNVAYTATLAASGEVTPYTWSLDSGALPTGLTLAGGTGVISGTPTATGTFNFTARVTAANGQSVTKPLSIVVSTLVTLWPGTTVPGVVSAGDTNSVELGVKFRSDVNGRIAGIRFYKASTNTGTHVANLWSSTGTKLATATFTGETASGWQQVLFSSPVPITANTIYVASYHAPNGRYSINSNYFATTGVDSPPLQALANGVSGGNGVYAYGATSGFPTQTWNASNYWVDVVFSPGPAPTLSSIAVTPASPTISTGSTQPFTATGTYSNGSTQNLTSQVTWASSITSVATINSAGLATAVNAGSTTISATLGTAIGSTTLTVQTTPLTITTTSLFGGNLNVAYTATLAASGEVTPYTWSLDSGALPTGLTLAGGTGVISGTPTATGTFNFTARVTAANGQSVTKPLSIVVSTLVTLWPGTTVPGLVDGGPDSPVELGVKFRSDVNGSITGIRFYKGSTNTGTHVAHLWTSSGTLLTTATFTGETASGWQQVLFSSPVPITANTIYVASYHANNGHYSADVNYFATTGVDSPPLHALANGVSGGNGVYAYGSTSLFPTQTWSTANYWVDVVFQP